MSDIPGTVGHTNMPKGPPAGMRVVHAYNTPIKYQVEAGEVKPQHKMPKFIRSQQAGAKRGKK